jgi:hypothetical protein
MSETLSTMPKKFGDIVGQDLSGWMVMTVYYLKLTTTTMGQFRAVVKGSDGVIIMTTDRKLLERVYKRLPRRSAKVSEALAIVHTVSGIGFQVENSYGVETEALSVFSEEKINALLEEGSVAWEPGLLSFENEKHIAEPRF